MLPRLVVALLAAIVLAGCQTSPWTYVPRLGDAPKTVDGSKADFWITTNVKNGGNNAVNWVLIQNLTLVHEFFKGGILIGRMTEKRLEAAWTNGAGDWIDQQAVNSALGAYGSDNYTYAATGRLSRSDNLVSADVQRLHDAAVPPERIGVFNSTFTVEFGPGADAATQDRIRRGKPADYIVPLPKVADETEEAMAFHWTYIDVAADGGHYWWWVDFDRPSGIPGDQQQG